MVNAKSVATQLRILADHLDSTPEADIPYAFVSFTAHTREEILAIAKLIPRPFKKTIEKWSSTTDKDIRLAHGSSDGAMKVWATAPQSLTCRLVKPAQEAVYDCESLLSPDEEEALA